MLLLADATFFKHTQVLIAAGHMIRKQSGSSALDLRVDSKLVDSTRVSSASKFLWKDAAVFWSGSVAAGGHIVWLSSPDADASPRACRLSRDGGSRNERY